MRNILQHSHSIEGNTATVRIVDRQGLWWSFTLTTISERWPNIHNLDWTGGDLDTLRRLLRDRTFRSEVYGIIQQVSEELQKPMGNAEVTFKRINFTIENDGTICELWYDSTEPELTGTYRKAKFPKEMPMEEILKTAMFEYLSWPKEPSDGTWFVDQMIALAQKQGWTILNLNDRADGARVKGPSWWVQRNGVEFYEWHPIGVVTRLAPYILDDLKNE